MGGERVNAADWLTVALLFVVLGYLALAVLGGKEGGDGHGKH